MKIALQKCNYSAREILAVVDVCSRNKVPFRQYEYGREVPKDEIAIGTVEFVEEALGKRFKPNYHPEWLSNFVFRKTWVSNEWPDSGHFNVVKPNDGYKIFDLCAAEFPPESAVNSKEFFCQKFVNVGNEWRVYVADGYILYCSWYKGPNEDKELDPATIEKIKELIPDGWCGTIDLMETENGIELCECHHPYSIGWYGNPTENFLYFDFLIKGYEYLKYEKEL